MSERATSEQSPSRHHYPDGSWLKPYDCLRCHAWWYYSSALMLGYGLLSLVEWTLWVTSGPNGSDRDGAP